MSTESRELPERDSSRPNTEQGLFRKFNVSRTDGSDAPGGKHDGCDYFVIDVTHDQLAVFALSAYADAAESTHPQLAADMRERYALAHSRAQDSGGEAYAPESVRHVAWHIGKAVEYIEKVWPDAKMLDRDPILRNMRRWHKQLTTAAEQPAKGECVLEEMGEGICDECVAGRPCKYAAPQPSDPADAKKCGCTPIDYMKGIACESCVEAQEGPADANALYGMFRALVDAGGPSTIARHGVERGSDAWATAVRAGMLAIERRFHPERFDDPITPPTAQRHDEGDEFDRLCDIYESATVYELVDRNGLRAVLKHLSAHGAGAAVEAVAHAIRLLEWTVAEHVYDAETEADFNRAIRGLESLPPQQRREQVAGGGGVDSLPAELPNDIVQSLRLLQSPKAIRELWAALRPLLAALSTQPLLSDQPAGVSEAMARMYSAILRLDGQSRIDVLATFRKLEAALHPEQAKDGAAG